MPTLPTRGNATRQIRARLLTHSGLHHARRYGVCSLFLFGCWAVLKLVGQGTGNGAFQKILHGSHHFTNRPANALGALLTGGTTLPHSSAEISMWTPMSVENIENSFSFETSHPANRVLPQQPYCTSYASVWSASEIWAKRLISNKNFLMLRPSNTPASWLSVSKATRKKALGVAFDTELDPCPAMVRRLASNAHHTNS